MPTINQLSPVDSLQGSDNFPIYDSSNGDARKVSATVLLDYVQENFANPQFATLYAAPTLAGFNVTIPNGASNQWVIITPSGTLASGIVTLPTAPFDGQEVIISFSQTITALTISSGATVAGAPGSVLANSSIFMRYNTAQNTWYVISSVNAQLANGLFATLTSTGTTVLNGTTIPASVTLVSTNATQTLTNKTLTSPVLTTPNLGVATATSIATGPVSGTIQSLSGPGAVDLVTYTTAFTSTGTGDALTLADGTAGQIKNVVYVAEAAGADTGVLTPTNFGNGSTITFNAIGDSCQLQFVGTDWWVISVNGAVVA